MINCPHRNVNRSVSTVATCQLVATLATLPLAEALVGDDACIACQKREAPTAEAPNKVVRDMALHNVRRVAPARLNELRSVLRSRQPPAKPVEAQRIPIDELPCSHRGEFLDTTDCGCGAVNEQADVFACALHAECTAHNHKTLKRPDGIKRKVRACLTCLDRTDPQRSTIYLNADAHGFGDAAFTAWISEGSKAAETRLVHVATGDKADFLRMLGQEVLDRAPAGRSTVNTFAAYDKELKVERGQVPRLQSRAQSLGIAAPPARPGPIAINVNSRGQARSLAKQAHAAGGKFIVLCPQTVYASREWPAAHWVDLAWKLKKLGHFPTFKLSPKDPRFENTPQWIFDSNWHNTAALIDHADVVVAVSSGPASLAATMGARTIVLEGPTAHSPLWDFAAPNVTPLAIERTELECTGCYFGAPFRAACDQGCQALIRLYPEQVLSAIERILTADATDNKQARALVRYVDSSGKPVA